MFLVEPFLLLNDLIFVVEPFLLLSHLYNVWTRLASPHGLVSPFQPSVQKRKRPKTRSRESNHHSWTPALAPIYSFFFLLHPRLHIHHGSFKLFNQPCAEPGLVGNHMDVPSVDGPNALMPSFIHSPHRALHNSLGSCRHTLPCPCASPRPWRGPSTLTQQWNPAASPSWQLAAPPHTVM